MGVRRSPNVPKSTKKYVKREDSAQRPAKGRGRQHSAHRKHANDPSYAITGGLSSQEGSSQGSSGSGGFDGGSSSQGSGGGHGDDLLVFDEGRRGVKQLRAKEALQAKPPRGPDGSALFALFSAHEKAKTKREGDDGGDDDDISPSMKRRGGGDDKHDALRWVQLFLYLVHGFYGVRGGGKSNS